MANQVPSPPAKSGPKPTLTDVGYLPPTRGLLSTLPASWAPYAELIRLHQPHGIFIVGFPHVVGLMYAASVLETPMPPAALWERATVLSSWVFFSRSAGCAWNDIIDQDLDRQTARCRNRPVARGAISTPHALIYTFFLYAAALAPLWWFLPSECTWSAFVSIALSLIYPFGKRFTHFAQVMLGTALGSTIFLTAYSVGLPALTSSAWLLPTGCLTATIVLLVVFYDTVYARADTADDLRSGVKGMAVRYRHNIEGLFLVLTAGIVGLLTVLGRVVGMHRPYYVFAVAGLAASLLALVALTRWNLLPSWAGSSAWLYAFGIANLVAGFGKVSSGSSTRSSRHSVPPGEQSEAVVRIQVTVAIPFVLGENGFTQKLEETVNCVDRERRFEQGQQEFGIASGLDVFTTAIPVLGPESLKHELENAQKPCVTGQEQQDEGRVECYPRHVPFAVAAAGVLAHGDTGCGRSKWASAADLSG
ncbi:uncharacterized protein PgNI_10026 [Pyricularia grisea]|uniref:Uncharacterized protein n=1 Tax=Pyricularia grisea TaxID=148305 RepID=A0A6P8AS82_PYRGI|nr:uncharacterized protein PgNI_10026 [Pyricularia grisea]TLD04980.1 hypothetical protein PgNI_10026 [Pyricularia grisea]